MNTASKLCEQLSILEGIQRKAINAGNIDLVISISSSIVNCILAIDSVEDYEDNVGGFFDGQK